MASDKVCISEEQRDVHVAAEGFAVAVVVPFLAAVALDGQTPGWVRAGAAALAVGTLAVDGALLTRWSKAKRGGDGG